ncbi:MAG: hypothetical protein FWE01_00940 [Firmicutes bacterium]|nr:hypothetical protein [Bacillota bacterium]
MIDGNILFDGVEYHLSRAEIAYKECNIRQAIIDAKQALQLCKGGEQVDEGKVIALRIFIARCYSRLGNLEKSNLLYRELVNENVYLPPVLLGLMHNNLAEGKSEKVKRNMCLVKIYLGEEQ